MVFKNEVFGFILEAFDWRIQSRDGRVEVRKNEICDIFKLSEETLQVKIDLVVYLVDYLQSQSTFFTILDLWWIETGFSWWYQLDLSGSPGKKSIKKSRK